MNNGDKPASPTPSSKRVIGYKEDGDEILATTVATNGLTKREAFAMAAMQGIISKYGNDEYQHNQIARWSVNLFPRFIKGFRE